jgi:DNA-binding beta-propeller fold protein YncE
MSRPLRDSAVLFRGCVHNAYLLSKAALTLPSLMPLQAASAPAGNAPNGVAVNPAGNFAYVVNVLSNDVSGYAISPDGSLASIAGSPFPAGSGAGWITVDPTGRFLYVANCAALCSGTGQGNVSGYAINKLTGALVPVPGSFHSRPDSLCHRHQPDRFLCLRCEL